MRNQYVSDQLNDLKLFGMANDFEMQIQNPSMNEFSFEQRLRSMIDHERMYRDNKRLQILLKKAKLKISASIEEIDYRSPRGIEKSQLLALTKLEWVQENQNLIITGPTGTGKTWIACAIGNQACRMGISTLFTRVTLLQENFLASHATGTFNKFLTSLSKVKLLILDDWGMNSLDEREQQDLFELIDSRVGTGATILTSQFPIEKWHDAMNNKTIADAVMDRLIYSSHTLKFSGESLRKKQKKLK